MYMHVAPTADPEGLLKRAHSISWLWFAVLAALALCVTLVLRLVTPTLPTAWPLGAVAEAAEGSPAVGTVMSFVSTWDEERDPLVPVGEGVVVKSSNYNGIMVDGKRYYYSLAPHMSYDPVSRGAAQQFHVVFVSPETDQVPVVIYTLE